MFYDEMENPKPLSKKEAKKLAKLCVWCVGYLVAAAVVFCI